MKKTLFLLLIVLLSQNLFSQNLSKNAIGLRVGDNDGFGAEVSYQRSLSDSNRLEFDLGLRNSNHVNAFKLVGLYQWVWEIKDGFNWYAGFGGGFGSWKVDKKFGDQNGTYLLAAGDVGIEYNFKFPLQVSLDVRPEFYFGADYVDYNDNFGPDIALGVRYKW